MQLRDYQSRAVHGVESAWQTARSVCLVAPTGSGKTVMGQALAETAESPLWVAHRTVLVSQTAERTGHRCETVQGLLARDPATWPEADLLIYDEVQHAPSSWGRVLEHYSSARVLGLTATPERPDGRPLAGLFERLVVAASYSELVDAGHLVPCDVWCPPEAVDGLATQALQAYQRHGAGGQAFVFWRSVAECQAAALEWPDARAVTIKQTDRERDEAMDAFRDGLVRSLHTVSVLTEGVDVPAASVCVLARPMRHASQYLQAGGRVLRPHPGKERAVLIDLCGSALTHGSPTEDRIYSLDGTAITRSESQPSLRQCLACGWTREGGTTACPQCGYAPPVRERPRVRIYSLELRQLGDVREADDSQRARELARLIGVCRAKEWSIGWALKQYALLFSAPPPVPMVRAETTAEDRRAERGRLEARAKEQGYKKGWVYRRYRATFGVWPWEDAPKRAPNGRGNIFLSAHKYQFAFTRDGQRICVTLGTTDIELAQQRADEILSGSDPYKWRTRGTGIERCLASGRDKEE